LAPKVEQLTRLGEHRRFDRQRFEPRHDRVDVPTARGDMYNDQAVRTRDVSGDKFGWDQADDRQRAGPIA
jgi:hypothetical protein